MSCRVSNQNYYYQSVIPNSLLVFLMYNKKHWICDLLFIYVLLLFWLKSMHCQTKIKRYLFQLEILSPLSTGRWKSFNLSGHHACNTKSTLSTIMGNGTILKWSQYQVHSETCSFITYSYTFYIFLAQLMQKNGVK